MFRILPRRAAATVFEYLDHEDQERLLRAMAQEDVAALLNDMAPDDRTMFLEELPAAATRQLLSLLTPEQRAVASTLLGYPEGSIGRLMTPDYVAVRESWTVREVLDYIREHGHDSETLNVVYVVDDAGRAHRRHPDPRVPAHLARPPRLASSMDRRFVALTATDDQQAAVYVFRQVRPDRAAGHRHGRHARRDRHDRRRAGRGGSSRPRESSSGSADRRRSTSRTWTSRFASMVRKRAGWLVSLVPRRDADRDGDGRVRDRKSRRRSSSRCSSRSSSRAAATRARRPRRWSSARWRSARSGCGTGGG